MRTPHTARESSIRQLERAAWDVRSFLNENTGMSWEHSSSNGDWFSFSAASKYVSVGIPAWGGYAVGYNVMVTFPTREIRQAQDVTEIADLKGKVSCFTKNGHETLFTSVLPVGEFVTPAHSRVLQQLARAIREEREKSKTARTKSALAPVEILIELGGQQGQFIVDLVRPRRSYRSSQADLPDRIRKIVEEAISLSVAGTFGPEFQGVTADPPPPKVMDDILRTTAMWRKCRLTFQPDVDRWDVRRASLSHPSESTVSSLRTDLIKLAHSHPEFRKELLPLIASEKDACGYTEGPMQGKFEEGKPADPTENMSPEDAEKWKVEHLKNKDNFKGAVDLRYPVQGEGSTMSDRHLRAGLIRLAHSHPEFRKELLPLIKEAGCEKLPEALRENCEKKQEEAGGDKAEGKEASRKQAGMAVVRKVVPIMVRIIQHRDLNGVMAVGGIMQIDFGSTPTEPIRFTAQVARMGDAFVVRSAAPIRPVSGGGADVLVGLLKAALQEAFTQRGAALLGSAADSLVDTTPEMSY